MNQTFSSSRMPDITLKEIQKAIELLEPPKVKPIKKSYFERIMNYFGWYKGQIMIGMYDSSKATFNRNPLLTFKD